ncbi:hypothetical protein ABZ722_33930 [Streptomyces longwoodensis]|uniref:hypothetical protein n=1 Tax=Streptomyces longwoodensis TaxID=68231 RepID=UPI0033D41B0F
MARFDASNLSQLQLDGVTCVVCGQIDDRPMIPVGPAPSGLVDLHAHRTCFEDAPTPGVVLVVGNTTTADDLADLTSFSCDVADRLGFPAVVAVGSDYNPTDFEAVVLADGCALSPSSALLAGEALLADVCVLWAEEVYRHPVTTTCGHCGEADREAAPIFLDGRWTVSVCPGCVSASGVEPAPAALVVA